MSQTQETATLQKSLIVNRTFRAPRERVFRAWTDASELALWFSPSADYTVVPTVDLRVGGAYRIEMHHKDGNVHAVSGTYREIKAPEKLIYTWQWESGPDAAETVVEVEFRSLGASTEVNLTHQNLPSEIEREKHGHGWNGCMERLAAIL
jgi:uncharacterized protein YndB with AHSA1/START domain